jgi:hypothetical protein
MCKHEALMLSTRRVKYPLWSGFVVNNGRSRYEKEKGRERVIEGSPNVNRRVPEGKPANAWRRRGIPGENK